MYQTESTLAEAATTLSRSLSSSRGPSPATIEPNKGLEALRNENQLTMSSLEHCTFFAVASRDNRFLNPQLNINFSNSTSVLPLVGTYRNSQELRRLLGWRMGVLHTSDQRTSIFFFFFSIAHCAFSRFYQNFDNDFFALSINYTFSYISPPYYQDPCFVGDTVTRENPYTFP